MLPGPDTHAFEKNLKRIATKGVVSLFNAITKHKRSEEGRGSIDKIKKAEKGKKADFLDILSKSADASTSKKTSTTSSDRKSDDIPKEAAPPPQTSKWSALKDDFMLGAKMKDWDKDSVSASEDGMDGDDGFDIDEDELHEVREAGQDDITEGKTGLKFNPNQPNPNAPKKARGNGKGKKGAKKGGKKPARR